MIGQISILVCLFVTLVLINPINAEERQCGDIKWQSEGHSDHQPKEKLKHDVYSKDICEVSKDIDHMKTKGEIDDWTQFKRSQVFATATQEQRDCLKEYFDSPDDGH